MHSLSLLLVALVATPASAAEPMVFHTSSFADSTTVQLRVLGSSLSLNGAYDYDIVIGLIQTDAIGANFYEDSGKHRAKVSCGEPAYIGVGETNYPIDPSEFSLERDDWKEKLWKIFCTAPIS